MAVVTVIGAGTMGPGIALVFALGGHKVRLVARKQASLDSAFSQMKSAVETLKRHGEIDASWSQQKLADSVALTTSMKEAVPGAELIVETINEDIEKKRALFAEIDGLAGDNAVLASNTSFLDIFPLVPERRLKRALIMHWYHPAYLVDLVDICPGPQTDPAIVEMARTMVVAMSQEPVVFKKWVKGYVANGIQALLGNAVFSLLDMGVSATDIDKSLIHGLVVRWAIIGIFGKMDFGGLDGSLQMRKASGVSAPKVLVDLVEAGRTGVKAGKGFYDWPNKSLEELAQERDDRIILLRREFKKIQSLIGTLAKEP